MKLNVVKYKILCIVLSVFFMSTVSLESVSFDMSIFVPIGYLIILSFLLKLDGEDGNTFLNAYLIAFMAYVCWSVLFSYGTGALGEGAFWTEAVWFAALLVALRALFTGLNGLLSTYYSDKIT